MMNEREVKIEMQDGERTQRSDSLSVMKEISQMITGTPATMTDMTEMIATIDSEAGTETTGATDGSQESSIHLTTGRCIHEKISRATKKEGSTARKSSMHMPSIVPSTRKSKNRSSTLNINTILGSSSDTTPAKFTNGSRCRSP